MHGYYRVERISMPGANNGQGNKRTGLSRNDVAPTDAQVSNDTIVQ
jgi:hypothetical protein